MKYGIDLGRISIGEYKELLKKQNLLLGRRLLLNDIDENFSCQQNTGSKQSLSSEKASHQLKK